MMNESKAMREIHEVMERSYEKRKGISDEDLLREIHKSSEELINR